jgi:putative toxin-antitoxin system antitoxin component (TIGR02293 family)
VLGEEVTSEADIARLVHRRIPLRALAHLERGGFSDREIGLFVIPERTQRHRRARRQPLSVEESDRLVRLARIQALAEDVFGDPKKANRWLREGLGILGGSSPLEVVRTDAGSRVIEQILAKIDWGGAA